VSYYKKISILLILSLLFFSLSATVFALDSKIYVENKPLDFISSGDDITYEYWLKEYKKRREAAAIEKQFPKSKITIGDIKGDFIEYDPVSGIKEVEIYFDRIKQIRNQGDLKGMFIDNGKIYVVVSKVMIIVSGKPLIHHQTKLIWINTVLFITVVMLKIPMSAWCCLKQTVS